jgi:hypothetical protein
MTAIFNTDHERGKIGERCLAAIFAGLLDPTNGKAGDSKITKGENEGQILEIKTDFYADSPNFFVEQFSDVDKMLLGGPFQAHSKGNKFYGAFLPHRFELLNFKTEKLIEDLKSITAGLKVHNIRNTRWITSGWAVPLEKLRPVAFRTVQLNTVAHVQFESNQKETTYIINDERFVFEKKYLNRNRR